MASQKAVPSNSVVMDKTGTPNNRKRNLSLPDNVEKSPKKVCNENDSSAGRVLAQARRSLYGGTPATKTQSQSICDSGKGDREPAVFELLVSISENIKNINIRMESLEHSLDTKHQALSDRIDQLESKIEKKLTDKVSQIVDKRFNNETKRLRTDIDNRIGDLKAEVMSDLDEMTKNFETLRESTAHGGHSNTPDISLNLVIRNLPEHKGENLLSKVNGLFKDKLKLKDITAHSVVRKGGDSSTRPGVVIATMENKEDKRKVMEAKKLLKSTNFNKVFIHTDQTHAERMLNNNLRKIVDAVNSGKGPISLRGGRIVRDDNDNRQHRSSERGGGWRQRGDNRSDSSDRSDRDGAWSQNNRRERSRSQEQVARDQRSVFGNNRSRGARGSERRDSFNQRRR